MIPRRFGTGCYAVCRDSRVRFGPRLGHAAWRYRTIRSRQPDTQPSITSLAAFWDPTSPNAGACGIAPYDALDLRFRHSAIDACLVAVGAFYQTRRKPMSLPL